MFGGLVELLFPTRCSGCDAPGTLLCPECQTSMPVIDAATACIRCGVPNGAGPHGGACTECEGREFAFSRARCAGMLEPPLSRMVALFKDGGERRLGSVLGGLAFAAFVEAGGCREAWPEAVIAVPASRAALLRRGFDHAEAIAAEVARLTGLPMLRILERTGGRDQRVLGRAARRANVANVFAVRSCVPALPPRVLLVDDVFTTGATLDAASRVLRRAGVADVHVLAVARACGSS